MIQGKHGRDDRAERPVMANFKTIEVSISFVVDHACGM